MARARRFTPIIRDDEEASNQSWKIAYADFVTAMMAFFLMLWLITALTKEQREALADYFSAIAVSSAQSGAGDMFDGTAVLAEDGSLTEPIGHRLETDPNIVVPIKAPVGPRTEAPALPDSTDFLACVPASSVRDRVDDATFTQMSALAASSSIASASSQASTASTASTAPPRPTIGQQILSIWGETPWQQNNDRAVFQTVEREVGEALSAAIELRDIADSVRIEETPEGLRIQITDQNGFAMFDLGGTALSERAARLLSTIAAELQATPNRLAIAGHTDARPYRGAGYSNWELSSDRAHAARRLLLQTGIDSARIARVDGFADREPLIENAPLDPRNRRISITLLRR